MEHPLIDKCPSCGDTSYTSFLQTKDWFLSQEHFELQKCATCSLVYTKNVPANIADYYKSDNYISHSESKNFLSSLYNAVQSITLRSKKQLLNKYSQGNKVLDYGAGKGDFTNYLHKSGFDITGYEPDPGARKLANEKHGITLQASIDIIPDNSLDAITMWHVLEHIQNPNEIIQQLLFKLKKTAVIIVAVPNHQSFDAKHYKEFWAAYDVPRHVTHYEQSSMSFFMKKNGLKIIGTKPMLFDSTYVSLLSEKYRTLQTGSSPGLFHQIKATIIGLISNIALILDKNRCSSLIYIIKHQ